MLRGQEVFFLLQKHSAIIASSSNWGGPIPETGCGSIKSQPHHLVVLPDLHVDNYLHFCKKLDRVKYAKLVYPQMY